MTFFWDQTGPLLKYEAGVLQVEDLNPEIKTRWRMSRGERFMTGVRFIISSILQS